MAHVRPIIMLALLTGARRGEIMRAEWDHVDLDRGTWLIPETKAGRPRTVPLGDHGIAFLSDLKQTATTRYVCPNPKTGQPFRQIYAQWNKIRKAAGLPDVRFHDLRHTYASALINGSRSLYEVQHILGHTQARTTQRYAHLTHETLRDAAQSIGPYMPALTTGGDGRPPHNAA
jgi:integrase